MERAHRPGRLLHLLGSHQQVTDLSLLDRLSLLKHRASGGVSSSGRWRSGSGTAGGDTASPGGQQRR